MSSAKACCSSSSVIAWPPYLITTVRPLKRSSQGSASISVAALAIACSRFLGLMSRSPVRSCGVGRVLVDVGGREVGGPYRRAGGPRRQVDGDRDLAG